MFSAVHGSCHKEEQPTPYRPISIELDVVGFNETAPLPSIIISKLMIDSQPGHFDQEASVDPGKQSSFSERVLLVS